MKDKNLNQLKKRMKCKNCGKTYAKNSFSMSRRNHESKCEEVNRDHDWSESDWIDLKDITFEEIELSRMKTQNMIFSDETMKRKLNELNELVIELLISESGENK